MPTYDLGGISVHFPYEAYPCQLDFMEKAIVALQNGENALLESPTGTGKTLCLLSAALAWRQVFAAKSQLESMTKAGPGYDVYTGAADIEMGVNGNSAFIRGMSQSARKLTGAEEEEGTFGKRSVPLIIYASRTHSQLSQVIAELRNTIYRPKIAVIGSREQMCINQSVRKGGTSNACLQAICARLVKKNGCSHYGKVGEALSALSIQNASHSAKIMDIEDIVKFGESHQACPYYLSRQGFADADVLFMPYNYVVDRKSRGIAIDLESAIIIFDEAHNLEGVCGEVSSFDISTEGDIAPALKEIKTIEALIEKPEYYGDVRAGEIKQVKTFLMTLQHQIMSISLDGKDGHFTSRGDFMYDLMARCGVSGENARGMIERFSLLAKALLEDMYVKGKGLSSKLFLQTIETVLRTLYKPDPECEDQGKGAMVAAISRTDAAAFRIFLSEEKADNSKTPTAATACSRKLSLWCFNPGMALRELAAANVRSFILASGTLSPMASFAHELQIPFKNQLENLHVIKPSQVMVTVLKAGPTDITLNSSFNQRSNVVYKSELGLAISRTARVVPDGLLIFFPSYALMDDCINHWKVSTVAGEKTTIWSLIIQSKLPFVEPKSKADLPKVMQAYAKVIDDKESPKGAVFFAVCRGKVSEGLDFADAKGRAVIITGIPFPPFKDPKVMLKKDYLTDVGRKTNTPGADCITLTGEEWYQQQASRAVNQAIGRVIRHRNDYGAILFFDERYAQQRQINQLSKWVRGHVRVCESFSGMCSALTLFFQNQAALSNHLVKNGSNSLPLTSSTKTDDSLQNALNLKQSLQKAKNFFTTSQSVPIRLAADSLDSLPEGPSIPMNMIGLFAPKESLKIDIPVKETPSLPPTIPTMTSHADLDLAKAYMAKVRATLSEEACTKFNLLLKGYRAKKIDVAALTESLLKLYDSQGCLDLIDDFKSFVSQKNRPIFDEKVEAFREAKRRPPASLVTASAASLKAEAKSSTEGISPRPHVKIEPIVQKILKSKKVCLGSSQTCPICRDAVDKPFEAKCGHICCFQCWTSWLNNTLECPLCRQRTRISQLKKIYQ